MSLTQLSKVNETPIRTLCSRSEKERRLGFEKKPRIVLSIYWSFGLQKFCWYHPSKWRFLFLLLLLSFLWPLLKPRYIFILPRPYYISRANDHIIYISKHSIHVSQTITSLYLKCIISNSKTWAYSTILKSLIVENHTWPHYTNLQCIIAEKYT